MSKMTNGPAVGDLGLEKVIQAVTDEILKSQDRIKRGSGKSIFFVEKAKVSINFVVKKSAKGRFNLFAAEADGAYSSERMHRVELELSTKPPLLSDLLAHLELTKEEAQKWLEATIQAAGE